MDTPHDRRRAAWDRRAASYDRRTAWLERRLLGRARAWVASRTDGHTLEVAVGTGANLPHYPDGVRLSAVDWSPGMLALAERRAAELGLDADLRLAEAVALPFPEGVADTVVATFVLCEVDSVEAAVAEMVRVLRPGGRLLLADHVQSTSALLRQLQRAAERVSVPRFGEHFTRRPLDTVRRMGLDVVETHRGRLGLIELVHARRS